MDSDLATLVQQTAARTRARDFTWAVGISAGVMIVALILNRTDWWLPVVLWTAFLAALAVRYRFSSGHLWAEPVQKLVETQLSAQRAEIADLRSAADVARALPEPLFILDTDGIIEHANPAAAALIGAKDNKDIEGRHFASVVRAPDVFDAAISVQASQEPQTVEFSTTGAVERWCRAYITPISTGVMPGGTKSFRSLIFVRDLTSEHRLDQMRADFIASASHELRTPLASVLGFIETLRGPAKDDDVAREKFLKIMQAQAERMQRLVSDLMSLSRIELNEHVPPRDVVNLNNIAGDVTESLAPLFEQAGAIVDLIRDEDKSIKIKGERDEIFQALQNLLDNSVKYGGDPAMIKLRVGVGAAPPVATEGEPGHRAGDAPAQIAARANISVDDLVYFQVRDFGPGIERAVLPRLTERFYRVNIERSRKSGGTGLGLAIVKHIVNRHQGGFQIESKLAGGTAFTCYFPPAS